MIRHFNYTDREDLSPKMFSITVKEGTPRTVDMSWELEGSPLPADANVYLEATASGSPVVLRFPFGTVANRQPPAVTNLAGLPDGNLRFTVKIVDQKDPAAIGRLVGLAENLSSGGKLNDPDGGRLSILPVAPVEMGERIWRLQFSDGWVFLQVNKNVPGILNLVKNDVQFFSTVFPEIIRQILYRALAIDEHYEVSNEDGSWQDQWLRYAIGWHPDKQQPPQELHDPLSADDREQLEGWIEEVVQSFCTKNGTANLLIQCDEEQNES